VQKTDWLIEFLNLIFEKILRRQRYENKVLLRKYDKKGFSKIKKSKRYLGKALKCKRVNAKSKITIWPVNWQVKRNTYIEKQRN
jgi:hypothetical protein